MASPRTDLVTANRIFAHHGILDAYGHCSIRDPDNPSRFLMARARAPELVDEDDIVLFDLAGEVIDPAENRAVYQERFIHAAIYEARPDVQSVCHSHTPSIIPFGVTDVRLRPVYHMAAMIGAEVPVWDIAPEFGETDLLVTNMIQARSLAKALGLQRMALMRGHGCVFTAPDIPGIVRHGYYMDLNARLQTQAHLMANGKVHYLNDGEIAMRMRQGGALDMAAIGQPGREWEAWCAQVGRPV